MTQVLAQQDCGPSPTLPGGFVYVPGGPFIYGPEVTYERLQGTRRLRPRQVLILPSFAIGRYPVTVGQWRAFVQETGHPWPGRWYHLAGPPRGWLRRYAPCTDYPPAMARYPMVDVTQSDALAYCAWLSARTGLACALPSEEQWEKAARGTDGRSYPWGEDHPRPELRTLGNWVKLRYYGYNLFVPPRREWARSGWYFRVGAPHPVGAIPQNVSPYGCYDMAGNIWEWTLSLYHPNIPGFHVVKGGSWGYSPLHTRCYVRSAASITTTSDQYHAHGTGFRVVINLN